MKMDNKYEKAIGKLESVINKNIYSIFMVLIIALLVISAINVFSVSITGNVINAKSEEIKEANKPAEIELLSIEGCIECFDISPIIDLVKEKNVKVSKEEALSMDSEKGRELIAKYGIEKLPSLLIFGETEKLSLSGFDKVDDALVFKDVKPLYADANGEIIGKVSVVNIVDSSCDECISLSSVLDGFGKAGVVISDLKKVEYNSQEGKEFISKFGVKQVPAMVISEDIDYYEEISQGLAQLNLENKQGFYALHSTIPPYRDLSTNKITGLVNLILLKDSSCLDCYDVNINKQVLKRFGMAVVDEKEHDVNSAEGKQLVSKYNIDKAPIIILSPEAGDYDTFVSAWKQVGTKEKDSWFVMRKPEVIGSSKNLITGEIIKTQ